MAWTCAPYALRPGCFTQPSNGYGGCSSACSGSCLWLYWNQWPTCVALSSPNTGAIASINNVPNGLQLCAEPGACFADAACLGACGPGAVCAWASEGAPCAAGAPGYACLPLDYVADAACFTDPLCGGSCGGDAVCALEMVQQGVATQPGYTSSSACSSGAYAAAPPPPAPPPPTTASAQPYCFAVSGSRCAAAPLQAGDRVTFSICASDGGLCAATPGGSLGLAVTPLAGQSGTFNFELSCSCVLAPFGGCPRLTTPPRRSGPQPCSLNYSVGSYGGTGASGPGAQSFVDISFCSGGGGAPCVGAVLWWSPLIAPSGAPPAPPLAPPPPPTPPSSAQRPLYRCFGSAPEVSCFADPGCFGVCDPTTAYCGLSTACSAGATLSYQLAGSLSGGLYGCLPNAAPSVAPGCAPSAPECACPGGACVQDAAGSCAYGRTAFVVQGCPSSALAVCGSYVALTGGPLLAATGCAVGSLFALGGAADPRFVALYNPQYSGGAWLFASWASSQARPSAVREEVVAPGLGLGLGLGGPSALRSAAIRDTLCCSHTSLPLPLSRCSTRPAPARALRATPPASGRPSAHPSTPPGAGAQARLCRPTRAVPSSPTCRPPPGRIRAPTARRCPCRTDCRSWPPCRARRM